MNKQIIQEKLEAVFKRTLAMYQPGIPADQLKPGTHLNEWNWGPGIAHYGLLKTYPLLDSTTQQAYFKFWREWFETYLDREPPNITLNGALLTNVLWQSAHDQNIPLTSEERGYYKNYVRERVEYYLKNAIRHESGVFGHTVAGIPESSKQVWSDNMFMLVLLLSQYAVDTNDIDLSIEMTDQLDSHYYSLIDDETGLLYHAWQPDPNGSDYNYSTAVRGSYLNKAKWGRGNGWAAMAASELLGQEEPGYNRDRFKAARDYFEALLEYQRDDGRWHTLMDKDWSYPETSVTAAIGFAFLKFARLSEWNIAFREPGLKALSALIEQITSTGEVQGVSGSTPVLPTLEDYNKVPLMSICTWGQGMALLALGEALKVASNE